MAYQHYRSPFGDTTFTKIFVGGLAWETHTDVMRAYFEQFGDILEAVIITDKNTGKSKGYGFVTFRDPDSARRACGDPNPVIDGRRANCNIAALGRPRPSPPRAGRNQMGTSPYSHGGASPSSSTSSYITNQNINRVPTPVAPPPPPPPPVIYPPYGYASYPPDYGYHQGFYNPQLQQPQYYHNPYATSSSPMGGPYFYGYNPMQAASRGTLLSAPQAQRFPSPPYVYYPIQGEGSFASFPPLPAPPILQRPPIPSPTDLQVPQHTSTTTEVSGANSESPGA